MARCLIRVTFLNVPLFGNVKTGIGKWRQTNRARFDSDAEFKAWQAARKAKWRRENPLKYKAELVKAKAYSSAYSKAQFAPGRALMLWAIVQKLRFLNHGTFATSYDDD